VSRSLAPRVRIALATSEALRTLRTDEMLLAEAFQERGAEAVGTVWSDPAVAWETFDLVLLRTTWDYFTRLPEFLAWVDRVSAVTRLLNPAETVHWNCNKTYLRDLERAGLPVVPTRYTSEVDSVRDLLATPGWERIVVKPVVSAGGSNTHLLSRDRPDEAEALVAQVKALGEAMLQPYIDSVERDGERSLLYVNGAFSHAIVKPAHLAPGAPLREGLLLVPHTDELAIGAKAARQGPVRTAYARVDLVRDAKGKPHILELEMIEPELYFRAQPKVTGRWADAFLQEAR
jgi:Prokaryotic glutathione synthetase, ATP-grasp domain